MMILEVFSNLNDSVILELPPAVSWALCCWHGQADLWSPTALLGLERLLGEQLMGIGKKPLVITSEVISDINMSSVHML